MKLYFDIGNTNIKLNYRINSREFYVSYPTKNVKSIDSFYNILPIEIRNLNINFVSIVSVVPFMTKIIGGMAQKYWKIKPMILNHSIKTGIKINTDNPKEVGADLIALSSFATLHGDNTIIVNLGTATTIIHVVNKELMGVIIAAGIGTQLKSLSVISSNLSNIKLEDVGRSIGKNTQEAVSIGTLHGHINMIKSFVDSIDKNAKVIISGGHAKKIKDKVDYEFVNEATIEGLKNVKKIN